jgi:hypothetical protein
MSETKKCEACGVMPYEDSSRTRHLLKGTSKENPRDAKYIRYRDSTYEKYDYVCTICKERGLHSLPDKIGMIFGYKKTEKIG